MTLFVLTIIMQMPIILYFFDKNFSMNKF